MTDLAPHLTTFLPEHLPSERRFSQHTVQGYTDCFRLLVLYAAEQTDIRPCELQVEHFTAAFLLSFLEFLAFSRVWAQLIHHLMAKSWIIARKFLADFSKRVANRRMSFILQKNRSTMFLWARCSFGHRGLDRAG